MSSNLAGRAKSLRSIEVRTTVRKDRKLPSFYGGLNPEQIKQGVKNMVVRYGLLLLCAGTSRLDGNSLFESR